MCVSLWLKKITSFDVKEQFWGRMKIACLKYYCVHFQLFLLKRFYSSAQIVLYHASWRSIWLTRNKAFFFVQKEGEVVINFALRKKRLEGVAKKNSLPFTHFFSLVIFSQNLRVTLSMKKIYFSESQNKMNSLKRRMFSSTLRIRFERFENMTIKAISRKSCTGFWGVIVQWL